MYSSFYKPRKNQREPRNSLDSQLPYAMLVEDERSRLGSIERVGTVFLTNRECSFHCTMCDLWKNTLRDTVRAGQIPQQIQHAIANLPEFESIKLYNSGNFFDPRAIPPEDYAAIAELVRGYRTTVVENHPRLCLEPCHEFARRVAPSQLEVALGLETCHAPSLAWLNKSMTLEDFDWALERLHRWNIKTRVFLLLGLPHMSIAESLDWTIRSIEYTAARGVECFSVIPTRSSIEPLKQLSELGSFQRATPESIEAVLDLAIPRKLGRVFVDLWDANSFFPCEHCRASRISRLESMNLQQVVLPSIECTNCNMSRQ